MSDRLCYKSIVPLYEFFIKNALLSINMEILSRIAKVTHALHVKISSHKSSSDLLSQGARLLVEAATWLARMADLEALNCLFMSL